MGWCIHIYHRSAARSQCSVSEGAILQHTHSSASAPHAKQAEGKPWPQLKQGMHRHPHVPGPPSAAGHHHAPLSTLLDVCTSAPWPHSPACPREVTRRGLHREASSGSWSPLRCCPPALARSMVAPGRETEQTSGSGNASDVLAKPWSSPVRAQSSGEVVPLPCLGQPCWLRPTALACVWLSRGRGADAREGAALRWSPPPHCSWLSRCPTRPSCRGQAHLVTFHAVSVPAHPRHLSPGPMGLSGIAQRGQKEEGSGCWHSSLTARRCPGLQCTQAGGNACGIWCFLQAHSFWRQMGEAERRQGRVRLQP